MPVCPVHAGDPYLRCGQLYSFNDVGILEGKRILVTGVLTDASLAFSVAKLAQEEGADIVLSGAGRGLSLTRRTARKLPSAAAVIEIDVTDPGHLEAAADDLRARW